MSIFRTKSLAEVKKDLGKTKLRKTLGVTDLIMLGLGAIIGTGIFVLTGLAAAQYAGPSITLSYLLGAVACVFTALAYAELAAMLPVAGSAYTYLYITLGEGFAALVGWFVVMVFTYGAATVAAGWSGYAVGILGDFGIVLPEVLTKIPSQGGWVNLPAVFIIVVLTLILLQGAKGAAKLNGILVFVKLGSIAWFLMAALPRVKPENWEVFAPNGFFGIAAGAGFVFMAYTGFDTLATAAEETKNPNRDLPIGIIGSLMGSAILYIIVAGALTAIVHYSTLNNPQPMAFALRSIGVPIGAKFVAAGAIAGMTTVILTQIYGQSRTLYVMARDGLMPRPFLSVDSKSASPYIGLILSGVAMAGIAGFMPVGTLGQLSSMSALAVYAFVSIAVMVMRYQRPDEKRPFRCPAVYLVASVSTLICTFLFIQLLPENWFAYLVSTLLGMSIYFLYGYRNSALKR